MQRQLTPPRTARAASFRRFLARAARRARRASGSGSAYSLTVLALFYIPYAAVGAVFELTGAPPEHEPWLNAPATVAALVGVLILMHAGWLAVGPLSAPPGWAAWVLPTPLDRGILLRPRWGKQLAVAGAVGIALGTAVAAASDMRGTAALALVLVGTFGSATSCAAAICRQSATRSEGAAHAYRWTFTAGAAVLAGAVALQTWPLAAITEAEWWTVTAVAGTIAALTAAAAFRAAGRIPARRLLSRLAPAAYMTFTELSLEPLATRSQPRRHHAGTARPLRGTGQAALTSACWRHLGRNRPALARFVITAVALYPLSAALRGAAAPALAAVGVLAATIGISGVADVARSLRRNPHLAAHLGLDGPSSSRTALRIPVAMAASWAVATAPAVVVGGSVAVGVLGAALGCAVVIYRLTRDEFTPTYQMGQQYPVDLARRMTRGPAQLVAACLLAAGVVAFL